MEISRIIYSSSAYIILETELLTCPWRFLRSDILEQLDLKLETIIEITGQVKQ